MLFKLLLNVENITTECARLVNTFPCLYLELCVLPICNNFLFKSLLELQLFVSRLSNFFYFLTELKERALEELLEGECLTLVRDFLLNKFDHVVPMAVAD